MNNDGDGVTGELWINDWTDRAAAALGALKPPHVDKKRATIIALVDARLAGKPEESVWQLRGVCCRTTYHLKWKKDPIFADVLDEVDRLAHAWKDRRALEALRESAEMLALASPAAVGVAIRAMANDDVRIALSAAFGVLDRASPRTAAKGQHEITGADGEKLFPVDELVATLKAIDREQSESLE